MSKPPRRASEGLITGWLFFRYMAVGTYVGAGTVGAAAWWYMLSPVGPHLSYYQLSHHLQCTPDNEAFKVMKCDLYLAQHFTLNLFPSLSAGNRLRHLPWPPSHDYGSFRLGHHWDVERLEQLVWEPVDAGYAALVQHLAHFGHCSFDDAPLHDPLRGDFVDRLSDLPINCGRVDRRFENISASRSARRGAQVLRPQIQRRWESYSPLPLDRCRLGPICRPIVPVPALSSCRGGPHIRGDDQPESFAFSHSTKKKTNKQTKTAPIPFGFSPKFRRQFTISWFRFLSVAKIIPRGSRLFTIYFLQNSK